MTGRQWTRWSALRLAATLLGLAAPLHAQRSDTLDIHQQVLRAVRHQLDSTPGLRRVILDPASAGLTNLTVSDRQQLGGILRAVTPDSLELHSCLFLDDPSCTPSASDVIVVRISAPNIVGDRGTVRVVSRTAPANRTLRLGLIGGVLDVWELARTPAGWRIVARLATSHGH